MKSLQLLLGLSGLLICCAFKLTTMTRLKQSAIGNGLNDRRDMSPLRQRYKISNFALSAKKTWKVTVQHGGKDTVMEVGEDCSILNAALDAGVDLPHDCNLGVCLTCPSKVVSGKVDQTGSTLDESVTEMGFALTCCTYPRSDVVIRSIDEDELVTAQFSREK